ncbi:hypothetical protein PAUR_b0313 [Pseudoalteromonas aurantia 208]|uniref:Transposase n=1 Tax=Pseudoalteromonas aurantia 208 TaxID=1314867 RepID=A0ABR9EHL1_9GAMM|nr:hypothetical protein [Pseudoalteromonas aurantia 208]
MYANKWVEVCNLAQRINVKGFRYLMKNQGAKSSPFSLN